MTQDAQSAAELGDFWRTFDVHRLQLRMGLRDAVGGQRHGLAVLDFIVPDPVAPSGAVFALLQRRAWLEGDWPALTERVSQMLTPLVADGLGWPEWLRLVRPIRRALVNRICDGFSGEPIRVRSASHGLERVLDHLDSVVEGSLTGPVASTTSAEEAMRLVMDAAPIALVAVAEGGRIVAGNLKAEALLGYGRGELDDLQIEDLMPQATRARHVTLRARYHAVPTARPMAVDKRIAARRKDGTEVRVEVGLAPYAGSTAKLVLASLFEVSSDRQSAAQLRRTLAELERSNEELEQFAYVVSHDLQEPLRMVSSYTELLRRDYQGKLEESADVYINYAVEGAQRLNRLVHELLQYSRVGSKHGSYVPTDTGRLLDNALSDLALVLDACGAEISVEGRLPTIIADSTHLQLVFQNLIANAVKFTRPGVPPRVTLAATRTGEHWTFSVADNGIGLDVTHAERIFGLFQRLHSREEYEGSGIGLTITRRIVERHGGRIWVESTLGEGTTFYFALPLWPVTVT